MGRGLETPQVNPAFDPRTLLQPPPQRGMLDDLRGGGGPGAMINRMREESMARQQGGSRTPEERLGAARDLVGQQGGSQMPEQLLGAMGGMIAGVGKEGGRSLDDYLGMARDLFGRQGGVAGGGGQGQTLPGGTPTLQPPPNVPPGTTAITGNEVPYQVNPNRSSGLQGLLDQLTGAASGGLGGAGSELFGALESQALNRMRNPGGFDEELMRGPMDEVARRAG